MNPAQLLAHFDRISDAPDAIPRLRRFILDLAVRGTLVEQDPNDQPAAELLELLKNSSHNAPPGLPSNWVAAKVGALLEFQYGKGLPAGERLGNGRVRIFGSNGVVGYCTKALTEQPAIIIGRKGSAGALNLCDGPSWTTDVAYFVTPPSFFAIRFLFIAFQTLDLDKLGKGVKPGLSRSDVYELAIAVPPPAEQHRIVAGVNELMAICDRLETARDGREQRRDRLAAASLNRLNQAADTVDDASAFRRHARFHLRHLPRLTARPDQIPALRQTILNLAVRGSLVPQDPNDEPASDLLKRIQAEKERLVKQGKIRKEKPLPDLEEADIPFEAPAGWLWSRLGNVGEWGSGSTPPRGSSEYYGGEIPWLKSGELGDCLALKGSEEKITEIALQECSFRLNRPGDVLIAMYGATIGKLAILAEPAVTNQAVCGCTPFAGVLNRYLYIYLLSRREDFHAQSEGGAQPNISKVKIVLSPFPLPPLAEQHRIVATVEELMVLCDRLEAQLIAAQTERRRLLEAVLHEALAVA